MRNIKLTLEYEGTNFVGWQVQAGGRTVQAELEKALSTLLRHEVKTNAAGRTDSGVHAAGQVANFRTGSSIELSRLVRSLNGLLPEDVAVRDAEDVPAEFHARYSAIARRYSYLITTKPSALWRRFSWHVGYSLDVPLLQRCAETITGEHDFRSYCKSEAVGNDFRCTVQNARWSEEQHLLRFTIIANRFLHGMVRALVGTMVDVGRGYTSPDDFEKILSMKDRRVAGMSAPAKGLTLEEVYYD